MPSRAVQQALFFAATGLVVGIATLRDSRGLRRVVELRGEVRELERRNAAMARTNEELAREVDGLGREPRYLERAIRAELGYVKPGEIVLELGSGKETDRGPPPSRPLAKREGTR